MRLLLYISVALAALAAFASTDPVRLTGPAATMQRKLDYIEANGRRPQPNHNGTDMTEQEINSYINSGAVKLPAGVSNVHMVGTDGAVTGTAHVDFDKIKEGRSSSNPLLSVFSGVHEVEVRAHGMGTNGRANVDVDSVSIDGVGVPRLALSFFIDHYLKPKYPGVGMHSTFQMPDRIDTAIVGDHVLTVLQK
jgi:hypothetical protein